VRPSRHGPRGADERATLLQAALEGFTLVRFVQTTAVLSGLFFLVVLPYTASAVSSSRRACADCRSPDRRPAVLVVVLLAVLLLWFLALAAAYRFRLVDRMLGLWDRRRTA
jgi:uncharacterized membrane protein